MPSYFRQDYLTTPDGVSLFYELYGEGEPAIVTCDGIGCDGFAWKYLLPRFCNSHRMLRWHYRGHGRSSFPPEPERIGFHFTADDLARVMDRNGMHKAVVFGHSMGVQVALEFHRRYPERVSALVLLCGSYGFPLDTVHDDNVLRRILPVARWVIERFPGPAKRVAELLMRSELSVQVALTLEMNRELCRREDVVPYFDHLARMHPLAFVRTLESLGEHSAWDHLPRVNVPTLVIGAEHDKFTPVWLSRRMADAIPDCDFMIVPRGTHVAPLEQPELVGQRIERFFKGRLGLGAEPAGQPALPFRHGGRA